jgi:hypothetical protein
MATREEKDLSAQIKTLAQKLKLEAPPTDGLDARELTSLLDQLRAIEGTPPGTQSTQGANDTGSKSDVAGATRDDGKGTPGPQTQSADVNPETGISPVSAGGSVRTEENPLPGSAPDEIAPLPDAAGNTPPKPAPSSTGWRVAPGKSIASGRGELLSEGAEIGERDVAGGVERLNELRDGGYVVETDKTSSSDEKSSK